MAKKAYGAATFRVEQKDSEPFETTVSGRARWALETLIAAGSKGCTPIETPGPRWSAYVHQLRAVGVPIETIHERHGGKFVGNHARYVLTAKVSRVSEALS